MSIAAEVLVSTKDLDHVAWLEARRKGIGGSDIGAICGVNPWKSPISVYMDKLGELPEQEPNDAMHFGSILEDVVATEYARRTGYRVQRRNAILHHPGHPWALANVDRLIFDKERGTGVLEVKTASEYQKEAWETGRPPEQYILQLQWYLWVTGLQWGAFAALVGGNKFYSHEMERDDELIAYIADRAEAFWHLVETRTPPDFDGSEDATQLLSHMYPASIPDTSIELPAEANELLKEFEEAQEQEKVWKERKDAAGNQLKALMADNEVGYIGQRKVSWKTVNRNTFDSKRFEQEHPDFFARYLKPSSSRRFVVR